MRTSAARLAALLLPLAAGACATRWVEPAPAAAARAAFDSAVLGELAALGRDGDWLVVRGYHASDNLVAALTDTPVSHAAVLDRGRGEVIEADATGVHLSTLADFVHRSHRVLLVRPAWSDALTAPAAVDRARALVGRRYDFLGLVGLDVPGRYYCSELAVAVYAPAIPEDVHLRHPVEPGQLWHWGRILFDSGPA